LDAKIRVGAVSYMNTRPLIYGLEKSPIREKIELQVDYPSQLAKKLLKGEIDLGLVPVAVIPSLPESHIIGDVCIGCNGPVASVCLFSEVPVEQIEEVWLDPQSRTSVALVQILLRRYWNVLPRFLEASEDSYRKKISGTTAGLVIGDRAFEQRRESQYVYDLGEAWKAYTGLHFVFAAWVSTKELPADFVEEFNQANHVGLHHLDEIISAYPYPLYDLHKYYTENVDYVLDERKRVGLEEFLFQLKFLTPHDSLPK
jgi:chorismate dehydratase